MSNKAPRMMKEMNNNMSEAARIARNQYHKKWYAENPDKVKAIHKRYWEKKAQMAAKEG